MIRVVLAMLLVAPPVHAGEPCGEYAPINAGDAASCDGVLAPTADLARLLKAETAGELCTIDLVECRRLREAAERRAREQLAATEAARRSCEQEQAPPPDRPSLVEAASTWVGAAIFLGAVVTGVATRSNHPLLWAAGGAGAGIVIGGAMEI